VRRSENLPEHSVLFGFPADIRDIDSQLLMITIGKFPLTVNGYSGFMPADFGRMIFWQKKGWRFDKISQWLYQIWPKVYLLLDRRALQKLERGWCSPFPWKLLGRDWKRLDCDALYCLYTQRREVFHDVHITRRVRTDVLRKNPFFCFRCRFDAGEGRIRPFYFRVSLNAVEVQQGLLTPFWKTHCVPLPREKMGRITGDVVTLELIGRRGNVEAEKPKVRWQVRGITFASKDALERAR